MKKGIELRFLVLAALIASLEVVTVRILPLTYFMPTVPPFLVRVSLQPLWYALAGWLLGPGWAMGAAMVGDVAGTMINATGNAVFYPGFTLIAALNGLLFGFILFRQKYTMLRSLITVGLHQLLITLPLTAYFGTQAGWYADFWIAFWAALPWRAAIIAPYALLIYGTQKALHKPLARHL
jgi:ECF transporter S component (folate family)